MASRAASREGWIRALGEAELTPFTVTFYAPEPVADGVFEARLTVSCKYFDQAFTTRGRDSMEALLLQPATAQSYLAERVKAGFEIYQFGPGCEFELRHFWGTSPDAPMQRTVHR